MSHSLMTQNIGLYVHSPFCVHKCGYCDFNSWGETSLELQKKWLNALLRQAEFWSKHLPEGTVVDSFFWGGGTPSLIENALSFQLLSSLYSLFEFSPQAEKSLEANPETLTVEKLELYESLGVNRISMGVQSFNDQNLERLERHARCADNHRALELIARHWKGRWSLDMMFALPEQSLLDWEKELRTGLEYNPSHISAYQLTLTTERSKKWKQASHDELLEFFDLTEEILKEAKLFRYEVSNFSKPGHECQHNLKYWELSPFLGLGPGASGLLKEMKGRSSPFGWHQKSPDNFETWEKNVGTSLFEFSNLKTRSKEDEFNERLMMGLRLFRGLPWKNFLPDEVEILKKKINSKALSSFFDSDEQRFRCNPQGLRILDTLLSKLFI